MQSMNAIRCVSVGYGINMNKWIMIWYYIFKEFGDEATLQKVWEEAVLTVFEDLLDDLEDEVDYEEDEETEDEDK